MGGQTILTFGVVLSLPLLTEAFTCNALTLGTGIVGNHRPGDSQPGHGAQNPSPCTEGLVMVALESDGEFPDNTPVGTLKDCAVRCDIGYTHSNGNPEEEFWYRCCGSASPDCDSSGSIASANGGPVDSDGSDLNTLHVGSGAQRNDACTPNPACTPFVFGPGVVPWDGAAANTLVMDNYPMPACESGVALRYFMSCGIQCAENYEPINGDGIIACRSDQTAPSYECLAFECSGFNPGLYGSRENNPNDWIPGYNQQTAEAAFSAWREANTDRQSLRGGDVVTFDCSTEFYQAGSGTVTCPLVNEAGSASVLNMTCPPKVCTCENGVGASGEGEMHVASSQCREHGASQCASCNDGFAVSGDGTTCEPLTCAIDTMQTDFDKVLEWSHPSCGSSGSVVLGFECLVIVSDRFYECRSPGVCQMTGEVPYQMGVFDNDEDVCLPIERSCQLELTMYRGLGASIAALGATCPGAPLAGDWGSSGCVGGDEGCEQELTLLPGEECMLSCGGGSGQDSSAWVAQDVTFTCPSDGTDTELTVSPNFAPGMPICQERMVDCRMHDRLTVSSDLQAAGGEAPSLSGSMSCRCDNTSVTNECSSDNYCYECAGGTGPPEACYNDGPVVRQCTTMPKPEAPPSPCVPSSEAVATECLCQAGDMSTCQPGYYCMSTGDVSTCHSGEGDDDDDDDDDECENTCTNAPETCESFLEMICAGGCYHTCFSGLSADEQAATRAEQQDGEGCPADCPGGGEDDTAVAAATTTTAAAAETHVLEGSMTLSVASAAALDGQDEQDALKAAIASQAGVDLAEVEAVVITVKVAGTVPLEVADASAFIADSAAVDALRSAIATVNSVDVAAVEVTLEAAAATRRLTPAAARRLVADVNAAFEFTSANGAVADAATAAMTADAMTSDLLAAINTELAGSDLEVTGVEAIMAEPAVEISYTIRTEDADLAAAAETAISSATPADMQAEIGAAMTTAGVTLEVTVADISAPAVSTVTAASAEPGRPGDASFAGRGNPRAAVATAVSAMVLASTRFSA